MSGPTLFYGDNMSVIHNTQRPESQLKKKSTSVSYHAIREAVAMGELLTGHVRSEDNPADICTKVIPGGMKRNQLLSRILSIWLTMMTSERALPTPFHYVWFYDGSKVSELYDIAKYGWTRPRPAQQDVD